MQSIHGYIHTSYAYTIFHKTQQFRALLLFSHRISPRIIMKKRQSPDELLPWFRSPRSHARTSLYILICIHPLLHARVYLNIYTSLARRERCRLRGVYISYTRAPPVLHLLYIYAEFDVTAGKRASIRGPDIYVQKTSWPWVHRVVERDDFAVILTPMATLRFIWLYIIMYKMDELVRFFFIPSICALVRWFCEEGRVLQLSVWCTRAR